MRHLVVIVWTVITLLLWYIIIFDNKHIAGESFTDSLFYTILYTILNCLVVTFIYYDDYLDWKWKRLQSKSGSLDKYRKN